MINDFGFGQTSDIGASRPMLFPYLWIEPTQSRVIQGNTAIDIKNYIIHLISI